MVDIEQLKFCQEVEQVALEEYSYIDAVIKVCESYQIDVAYAAKLLSQPIIEKIQQEGENINLLPKMSKLPI